jgi:hypothetical protein
MLPGINRIHQHDGKDYHLQVEDLGLPQACFEARVYDGGTVLWHKRIPYAELIAQNLPKLEQDDALRSLMEKTLIVMQAAIAKGKLT